MYFILLLIFKITSYSIKIKLQLPLNHVGSADFELFEQNTLWQVFRWKGPNDHISIICAHYLTPEDFYPRNLVQVDARIGAYYSLLGIHESRS